MSPFSTKKKSQPSGKKISYPFGKSKSLMDDLESPDPVEGKSVDDAAEENAESTAEESTEDADYGAKLASDITAAGATLGMDAATSRKAAGAFFKAAGACLMGGDDEGDPGQNYSTGEMSTDDIAY